MTNETLNLRKATLEDAGRIWQIIQQAQERMRLRGSNQWQDGYPNPQVIERDIEHGYGYVLYNDTGVIAYASVIFDGEPAYDKLEGKWLTDQPYVVVHRLAVADEMLQQGIATLFMQQVGDLSRERGVYSFRVDTNYDNLSMQKVLSKLGFVYCGEVVYRQGDRRAYEKVL